MNIKGLVLHASIDDSSKKIEIKPERPLHITMAALDTSVDCMNSVLYLTITIY